jgi:membrane-associated phospholipid phosphatase
MLWDDRPVRFRLAIASLLAFVLVTVLVAGHWSRLARLDRAISAWARRSGQAHSIWIDAWRVVTHCGDTVPLVVLGGAAVILLLASLRPLDAAVVVAVPLVTQALTLLVRVLLARHRPVDPFTPTSGFSYPSGHTVHSTVAVLLAVHLLRNSRERRSVAWLLGSLAALIGASRVLLLAHWPTDVVGGWLLALGVGPLLLAGADVLERRGVTATGAVRRMRSRPPPSSAAPHNRQEPDPPTR